MGIILVLDINKDYHIQRLKNNINSLDRSKKYLVNIKEYKPARTLNQNSYLWGVVYKMIANEIGSDADTVHEDLKREFGLKEERASIITGEISEHIRSTKTYDTLEMTNYINNIKNWAISFLGVVIPEANSDVAHHIYENQI